MWQVNNQVLVEMARDIRPPPLEPSEVTKLTSDFVVVVCICTAQVRSPRGAKVRGGRGQKESTAAFGPMPNFEREVQRIIAEQETVNKVQTQNLTSQKCIRKKDNFLNKHMTLCEIL